MENEIMYSWCQVECYLVFERRLEYKQSDTVDDSLSTSLCTSQHKTEQDLDIVLERCECAQIAGSQSDFKA